MGLGLGFGLAGETEGEMKERAEASPSGMRCIAPGWA